MSVQSSKSIKFHEVPRSKFMRCRGVFDGGGCAVLSVEASTCSSQGTFFAIVSESQSESDSPSHLVCWPCRCRLCSSWLQPSL